MVRIFDFKFSNLNLGLSGTFLTSILPLLIIIQLSSWCNNYIVQSFHGLVLRTLDSESSNLSRSISGTFSTWKVQLDHLLFREG